MSKITINGISLDPHAEAQVLSAANLHTPDASSSDYILLQTTHPLNTQEKAQLAAKGVSILEYVPEDTYLCHYQLTDLNALRALPFVTWANVYLAGFKIARELADSPPGTVPKVTTMARKFDEAHSRAPKTVDLVLHRNVDVEAIREKIADAARLDPHSVRISHHKVRLIIPVRRLKQLAELDEVRHIEEVVGRKLHNDVARGILRVGLAPAGGQALLGEDQIVAVADTGFDKGSTADVHPAFQGRVVKLYPLGREHSANDPDGHGTHVAGSVLGDGNSAVLQVKIRGTAPKAQLVLQSVLDSQGGLGGLPDDLHDLFRPPYEQDNARVHTNSWGSTRGDGRYDANAREIDDFVWNHRDLVICFAAGNAGTDANADGKIDPKSVTAPGTAKNCLTIGATESDRPTKALTYGRGWPDNFPADPIASDRVADNDQGLAAFSSRGPTADGRIKPDVVAPGTYILSTRSRDTKSNGWEPSADPLYFFEGGTSMATPLVAGCTALVRQHLVNRLNLNNPSAALVKAMVINGARAINGQYVPTEVGAAPNDQEGFGRVDIAATIGPYAANETVQVKDETTALDTGAQEGVSVALPADASVLKVTLVWTDPPGDTLQNDLDLIVRDSAGNERHGNAPENSTEFDRVNNVEQVTWMGIAPGNAEVIVQAFRVTHSTQPYALVIRIQ